MAPVGSPPTANVIAAGSVVEFRGLTIKVYVAVLFGRTVRVVDWNVKLKSPTVSVNAELVPVLKLLSPEYTAVIECEPELKEGTTRLATPAVTGTLPRLVVPSRKLTLPVGVAVDEDTVAVRVTAV